MPTSREGILWPRYIRFKYNLGQKYYAPQVRPGWDSNSWLPDHDGTFHVTETPALTTWLSLTDWPIRTLTCMYILSVLITVLLRCIIYLERDLHKKRPVFVKST